MKTVLWTRVHETYQSFPVSQHDGPLMFIIMMKLLVSHLEWAMKHLVEMVKNLKILKVKDKNIHCIISLIMKVLSVLQMSSVAAFNHHFKQHQF